MTVRPVCDIKIGNVKMKACNAFEVDRSIWNICAKATIKIPMSGFLKNSDGSLQNVKLSATLKAGDKVVIKSGYNEITYTEFNGYVYRINQKQPLEIECEDYTYLLHKVDVDKIFTTIKVKDFLEQIAKLTEAAGYDKMKYNTDLDMTIDKLSCEKMNATQSLEELKKRYGLNVFFSIDNILQVTLAYTRQLSQVNYDIDKNVVDINDLKYQNADDIKIKIVAVSYDSNMKKTRVEVGDSDGETRTLSFQGIKDKNKLKQLAQTEINKYKYSGYTGTFKTWLVPFCEPCMIANLTNNQFSDRSGRYYIEAVKTEFNMNGARRLPHITVKL